MKQGEKRLSLVNQKKRSSANNSSLGLGGLVSEGSHKKSKTALKQLGSQQAKEGKQKVLPVLAAEEIKLMGSDAEVSNLRENNTVISKVNNFSLIEADDEESPTRVDEGLEESKSQLGAERHTPSTFARKRDNKYRKQFSPHSEKDQDGNPKKQHLETLGNIENTDDDSIEINAEEERAELHRRLKQIKHIELPPPLELIARSAYKQQEPVKTGAPIPFVSLAQLAGGRFRKEEACGKTKAEQEQEPEPEKVFPVDLKPDVATLRSNTTNIQQYMQSMNENGYVVYCRFGPDYISHLIRQQMMNNNNPLMMQPQMRQIATYLINIKKLIKDHNIESDTKDFSKLKT